MLALVLEKMRLACIALANRFACFVISSCSSRGNVEKLSYLVPTRNGIAVYRCEETIEVVWRAIEIGIW